MTSGADSQYPTMTIEQLKSLDIDSITADDCILVMWWVGSQPQEALDLCDAWGFTLKNMNGFVWEKLTVHEKPFLGMGFWTRAGSESALIATKGKPKRASAAVRAVRRAVVGKHSQKPNEFRDDCVKLAGNVPRLEMFARKLSAGWDVFGNEAPGSIQIESYPIHDQLYYIRIDGQAGVAGDAVYSRPVDRFYLVKGGAMSADYVTRADVLRLNGEIRKL